MYIKKLKCEIINKNYNYFYILIKKITYNNFNWIAMRIILKIYLFLILNIL